MEALEAILSIAAKHKEAFSIMHPDVSRAYFYTKVLGLVLVRLPVEDRTGVDAGKFRLLNKIMYAHGTQQAVVSTEFQE